MQTERSSPLLRGLSATEVRARTAAGGANTAGGVNTRSVGQIIRESVFTFINNTLFTLERFLAVDFGARYGSAARASEA